MANTIKIPLSTLQENAKLLSDCAEDNEDIFDVICRSLESLEANGEWIGKSQKAAVKATLKNNERFREVMEDLNALSKFLTDFVEAIVEKEEEIKKRIPEA